MSTRAKNLEEIFHEASEIGNAEKRAEYLEKACSGDQKLRSELEFLLESDDGAGDFMEVPVVDPSSFVKGDSLVEGPGTVVGHYKLLEKIGEGGMAVVYMAEQQYPIQRKVALKLVKLGMDTAQVIARFEAERQALALMDHPHIARVFDAGTTESGRPYFVMELVKGMSITQFCDKKRLNTQNRLKLFVSVCQAVHHAHQKGIIHRDIKPSNIMVTLHDGQPIPKVIDFGIAKATNRRLTEKTLFTHYAQIIGTPEYMSPEQAEMSDLDIDTRTDVYSLGVLLYELLTGRPPFEVDYLRSKGYAEIQRIIREEEPTKPSTKISTLGDALLDIADLRRTTPDALRRLMRADLDWIVMRAMEKERTRRYDSPRELCADIERHLKHEPVMAGPPSNWYRSKKFLQRHRTLVAMLLAVVLALVLGIAVSTSLFEIQASKDRQVSMVQSLYAKGRYQVALGEIENSFLNKSGDVKVQLLHAQLLYNVGRKSESQSRLERLLDSPQDIVGSAHYLLSHIKLNTDTDQSQAHREQADRLSPSSADGHALRALSATTPEEALKWLDKALVLDQRHYSSREARALVYYGMRNYKDMKGDAEAITLIRSEDYLGFALRAVALRELDALDQALSDHDRAIELCDVEGERPILFHQRQETHWRLGNDEAALEDARTCVTLDPDSPTYRVSLAKILFKLRQYKQTKQEFDHLAEQGAAHTWQAEMSQYLSDAISADAPVDIPTDVLQDWSCLWVPPGILLPTMADLYRTLNVRAKRLVRGSYDISSWSPDGQQLAYTRSEFYRWDDEALPLIGSTGLTGRNGIEVRDLNTGRTRVLTTSGSRPTWSPDGRFLAFERSSGVYRGSEEIWLIPAQGGTPQRIVVGNSPSWTNHHTRLYYVTPQDEMLCYVDVNDPTLAPTQVVACPGWHAQVSPDERFLAYAVAGELNVIELATGEERVKWVVPGPGWNFLRWSPDGREISLGIGWIQRVPSGLWIFDVERKQGRHVLDPMALSCNWSPDHSRVAVDLGYPMNEVWLAEVDPNQPTWEALGGGQTRAEYLRAHWQRDLEFYRARIPLFMQTFLRNACAIAVNQYAWGEYEDALWSAQQIAELPEAKGTLSEAKTLAYVAMSLTHLDRHEEARRILTRLRLVCAKGEATDESCLYEAETVLATHDSTLVAMWELIQDGQPDRALDLLKNGGVTPVTPIQAEALQSVGQALARTFSQSAQEARHQGHAPRVIMAAYEATLRADPNHVPVLRDCALLLATSTDADLRNGARARLFAQRACEKTVYKDHSCLVSLAAASAECGDFSGAVRWQQEALKQFPTGQSKHELLARLELYESGRHLHVDRVEPLVAWWPFAATDTDGGYVQDASGHGLQGRLVGDAKIVTDPDRGQVLSLGGQGDWMECAHHARFNLVDEISISLWIKVKALDSDHQAIITKGDGDHTWEFLRRPKGKMVGFHCKGLDIQDTLGVLSGNKDVDDGQWHHLVGVYNGMLIYQYVDGKLDVSAPAQGKINLDTGPIHVGASVTSFGSPWNGLLDDVRIYNRALSVSEIKGLYSGHEPLSRDE
jgi:serine/threonine protein kinase